MKKLIILVLVLLSNSNLMALDLDRVTASNGYISSYSDVALFFNLDRGETIDIYTSGSANLFCGMSTIDDSQTLLLAQRTLNLVPITYTAPSKNLYILLCMKSSGLSGNSFVIIERSYSIKRRALSVMNMNEPELINKLLDHMSAIMD